MPQCDLCDKTAVVHETLLKHGVKKEVHLCEEHAKTAGIALPSQHQPINQILTQFVISHAGKQARVERSRCGACGLSYAEFRQSGTVGCPDCYEGFETNLTPLIERAQNGGTHHVGKAPQRAGASIDRQLQIQRLARELDSAVAAEQYERAAEIRDRLKSLEIEVVTLVDADEETAGSP